MAGNNETRDGLRVLFPTLIYEAWYPEFSAQENRLVSYVETLREQDEEGREISAEKYPSGYTSYFSNSTPFNDSKLEESQGPSSRARRTAPDIATGTPQTNSR